MLNKQGKSKIDYCDYSLNPISGRCLHNCHYCYMHSIWRRFPETAKLQLKENYLNIKLPKKPSKIFVGSSTDMWGEWVPAEWIQKVLDFVGNNPEHTFQFLTKNPIRYQEFFSELKIRKNIWLGTTVDGTKHTENNLNDLCSPLTCLLSVKKFVSFEPLINEPDIDMYSFSELDWIIIGADSTKGVKSPPMEWAERLIKIARSFNIPVWVKDNYGYTEAIKEFPNLQIETKRIRQ